MDYAQWRLFFFLVGILGFTALGGLWPQRSQAPISQRLFHNLLFGSINPLLLKVFLSLSLLEWAYRVEEWGWGLLNLLDGAEIPKALLMVFLFDGFIYWQHRLSHRLPWLWLFHRVHHSDIEFDSSTALRFHFVEILGSFVFKMLFIAIVGGPVLGVLLFEVILNFSAMFNHSNWKLHPAWDRVLRRFIVTPDFHRVHHSIYPQETNSNYGFFLPLWDYLFQSYVDQPRDGHKAMTIGLEIFNKKEEQNFIRLWTQPFRKG